MSKRWGALAVLSAAQFVMVLDQSVMNVSISQLVADFDTDVTTIQAVITLYSLSMAALMVTGGKLGDLAGRRRIFVIGLVIYGCGSLLTSLSWSVGSLALGWSLLEGIGAAMVLPAMVALTAEQYSGRARATAYGVLGGVAGAGIAVGPILGGWVTTNLTWRLVFAGEVVLVVAIIAASGLLTSTHSRERERGLDWVGAILSAAGLTLIVLGVLQAGNWGWLQPRSSPIEPFGFSLTPFVIGAGALLLYGFGAWERRRERSGGAPLVRLALLRIPQLRAGLTMLGAQNLILMGIFFAIPLYLQVVQGFDAFQTGVRMLPVSVTMLLTATLGGALSGRLAPRRIVRAGLLLLLLAVGLLLATIDPQIDDAMFAVAMGVVGVGLGLLASQLGNVTQSAVEDRDRSEAGGLQFTAQQFGASLGTAAIGAILITGLIASFNANVAERPGVPEQVQAEVGVRLQGDVSFVTSDQVRKGAAESGASPQVVDDLVAGYEDAQLVALKTGLLAVAFIVLASLPGTRRLPAKPLAAQASADRRRNRVSPIANGGK